MILLSRLEGLSRKLRASYASAQPYPHVVIDRFFPSEIAERILADFPPPETFRMETDSAEAHQRRGKRVSWEATPMSPFLREILNSLGSEPFLQFLSDLTGIEELVGTPEISDALRHFETGGRLGIHSDFNWSSGLQMHRRLNLLVYLNQEWKESWKGSLELWDTDGTRCVRKIEPVFNRAVIFTSTDTSFHGFPDPLECPEGVTRKSLQRYYYTRTRPATETSRPHGTIFL